MIKFVALIMIASMAVCHAAAKPQEPEFERKERSAPIGKARIAAPVNLGQAFDAIETLVLKTKFHKTELYPSIPQFKDLVLKTPSEVKFGHFYNFIFAAQALFLCPAQLYQAQVGGKSERLVADGMALQIGPEVDWRASYPEQYQKETEPAVLAYQAICTDVLRRVFDRADDVGLLKKGGTKIFYRREGESGLAFYTFKEGSILSRNMGFGPSVYDEMTSAVVLRPDGLLETRSGFVFCDTLYGSATKAPISVSVAYSYHGGDEPTPFKVSHDALFLSKIVGMGKGENFFPTSFDDELEGTVLAFIVLSDLAEERARMAAETAPPSGGPSVAPMAGPAPGPTPPTPSEGASATVEEDGVEKDLKEGADETALVSKADVGGFGTGVLETFKAQYIATKEKDAKAEEARRVREAEVARSWGVDAAPKAKAKEKGKPKSRGGRSKHRAHKSPSPSLVDGAGADGSMAVVKVPSPKPIVVSDKEVELAFAQYKTQVTLKYRELVQQLKAIERELNAGGKSLFTNVDGSHRNAHGVGKGATLVRKSEYSPSSANTYMERFVRFWLTQQKADAAKVEVKEKVKGKGKEGDE